LIVVKDHGGVVLAQLYIDFDAIAVLAGGLDCQEAIFNPPLSAIMQRPMRKGALQKL
jgi:hypothetical protein